MDIILVPTIKQDLAYEALRNPITKEVFMGGGAGGGKTWLICESRLVNALRFPGYRSFIGREELKRLMQSTYVTWAKVCQHHKIPQSLWTLNGQYNYIQFSNGSRIDLLDLKFLPSDPLYERFGSLEYTDGAVEEAGEVNALAVDVLKSRIGRHKNQEFGLHPTMLITGNPKKNWTYKDYYKPWKAHKMPQGVVFIQALYKDNPHTAFEYGKQLEQIKDVVTKERLMYGNWEYDIDDNALIKYDSIIDLFTNSVKLSQDKFLSADIARYGGDKIRLGVWQGLNLKKVQSYAKQGIDTTTQIIREIMKEEQIPYSHCIVDDDGVGGGVVDNLRGIKGFVNNSTAIEVRDAKQNYQNLKTQCSYLLADYITNHKIGISSTLSETDKEQVIEELEQIKRFEQDKENKMRIVPKDKVKEIIGRSPDWSDMMMMRMYFEINKPVNRLNDEISLEQIQQLASIY